jgi:hypothetical protein
MAKAKNKAKNQTEIKFSAPKKTKTKRVTKSSKLKAHQTKFGKINNVAFQKAYEDGKNGKTLKTPKKYYKDATDSVYDR